MRRALLITTVALLNVIALPALADPPGGCPPGLAKKGTGCLPPGQAKKVYGIGERIEDGILIRKPGRHGLDPNHTYYRVGDYVYRVDRDTREVLDLVGAIARVLN